MERTNHEVDKLADMAGLTSRQGMLQTLTLIEDPSETQFGLIEMSNELLSLIRKGESFVIRGEIYEEAVVCTNDVTYEMRAADTSNALLLVPSLKTPKCIEFGRTERRKNDVDIVSNLSSYYELKRVKPKMERLRQLLGKTKYRGPHHDSNNADHRFKFDDLKSTIQASEREIIQSLSKIYAFELDGFWRILDIDYKEKVFSQILKLVEEEQWELDRIPLERACEMLKDLYPREVLRNCLEIHGDRQAFEDDNEVIYRLSEERVCQFVAECILKGAEKFDHYEFFEAWQQSVPDGLQTSREQLKGIALEDVDSYPAVIWHFPAYDLPDEPSERFNTLFKVRAKWTRDEIEPYIRDLCESSGSMNALLLKFSRCSTDSIGNKMYSSKRPTW